MKVHFFPPNSRGCSCLCGIVSFTNAAVLFFLQCSHKQNGLHTDRAAQMKGTLIWIILRFPHLIKDIFHKCRLFLDQSSIAVIL